MTSSVARSGTLTQCRSRSLRVIGGGKVTIGRRWVLVSADSGSGARQRDSPPPGTVPGLASNSVLTGLARCADGSASWRAIGFCCCHRRLGLWRDRSEFRAHFKQIVDRRDHDRLHRRIPLSLSCRPETRTSAGWTAGAGGEWAVTDKWRLKVEYLHVALGDRNHRIGAAAARNRQRVCDGAFQ